MSIGEEIKIIRLSQKKTQAEIANLAGIRVATISDIENGKTPPKFDTLIKILKSLKSYYKIYTLK